MNEQDQQLPPQARAALDDCFARIRLARATELAQSKRFAEAEAVLARIAAQQEQFGKARRLWEAALHASPAEVEYSQCLERARKWERTSGILDRVLNYVVWVVVLFSIAAIVYAFKPSK